MLAMLTFSTAAREVHKKIHIRTLTACATCEEDSCKKAPQQHYARFEIISQTHWSMHDSDVLRLAWARHCGECACYRFAKQKIKINIYHLHTYRQQEND